MMEEIIEQLIQAVKAIEERNARVEAEKAWETSFCRISIIALTIYLGAAVIFVSLNIDLPFLNAMIPAFGYVLSMQTLPILKKRWMAKRRILDS